MLTRTEITNYLLKTGHLSKNHLMALHDSIHTADIVEAPGLDKACFTTVSITAYNLI